MIIVCHMNVRSLMAPGRLHELKLFCSMHCPDVLCLSETWLKPCHTNPYLNIPNYQLPVRCDRQCGKGGGVAVYVRDGLAASRLCHPPTDSECVALRLDLPKRKTLYVVAIYRPPKLAMGSFLDHLNTTLSPLMSRNVCIVGDFNAKNSLWYPNQETDLNGEELKMFADCRNLQQLVRHPTYTTTSGKPVQLDLFFTNRPAFVNSSFILPPLADHCATVVELSFKKNPPPKPFSVHHYLYADADLLGLDNALRSYDWSSVLAAPVDVAAHKWTKTFLDACHHFIPSQSIRVKPSSKPWYSRYIRYLASYRDRLFNRAKDKATDSPIWTAYKKMRNLFVAELRASERRYFLNIGNKLLSNKTPPSRWWSLAKSACGWTTRRHIPALQADCSLALSPTEKARLLNQHFQVQCSSFPMATCVPSCPNPRFQFSHITPEEVHRVITSLPNRKTPGSDNITNELLKLSSSAISQSLSELFNKSLSEGVFPSDWKLATISPVLKDGKDPTKPVSYRPIALLSCVSKLFERLVHDQLMKFCFHHDVLPREQFGFLKGRSAEWQLLSLAEDWSTALDNKKHVHTVFLDAAKAFDRVDHSLLLQELSEIGVNDVALRWFQSYLSNRQIQTTVDRTLSPTEAITSGVPQGSVLGPLLFILHFKDLPSAVCASSALFADDSLIYRADCRGDCVEGPCCQLQEALSDVAVWTTRTRTTLNPLKSAELIIGPRPTTSHVNLEGASIPRTTVTKHLGVWVNSGLTWGHHIDALIKSVTSRVSLCKLLSYRHHLPCFVVRRFYVACIRPRLEYCSAVWSGAPLSKMRRLERLQLEVVRALLHTRCNNLSSALRDADLPTLSWRRRNHCLVSLWRLVHGEGPPQLAEFLPLNAGSRSVRSLRSPHALQFPRAVSSRRLSSFLCTVIPLWNDLPSSLLQSVKSSSVFHVRLCRHFAHDRFSFGL